MVPNIYIEGKGRKGCGGERTLKRTKNDISS